MGTCLPGLVSGLSQRGRLLLSTNGCGWATAGRDGGSRLPGVLGPGGGAHFAEEGDSVPGAMGPGSGWPPLCGHLLPLTVSGHLPCRFLECPRGHLNPNAAEKDAGGP